MRFPSQLPYAQPIWEKKGGTAAKSDRCSSCVRTGSHDRWDPLFVRFVRGLRVFGGKQGVGIIHCTSTLSGIRPREYKKVNFIITTFSFHLNLHYSSMVLITGDRFLLANEGRLVASSLMEAVWYHGQRLMRFPPFPAVFSTDGRVLRSLLNSTWSSQLQTPSCSLEILKFARWSPRQTAKMESQARDFNILYSVWPTFRERGVVGRNRPTAPVCI